MKDTLGISQELVQNYQMIITKFLLIFLGIVMMVCFVRERLISWRCMLKY